MDGASSPRLSPRPLRSTLLQVNTSPPARRVYHDWETTHTRTDPRLGAAFEHTNVDLSAQRKPSPRSAWGSSFDDDDEVTGLWLPTAIGLLVGGFFLGRWWAKRKTADKPTVVAGDDVCGFDMLGVV